MSIKFPDCCIALRQAFEADMVFIPKGCYSDKGTIYWFNGQKEVMETKTCPFCGKTEDHKITIECTGGVL